jgi:hypothetical protein
VLQIGDDGYDSEDQRSDDDVDDDDQKVAPPSKPVQSKIQAQNLKATAVDNQHHDLAVDVNDSEEIDSEEEDDVHQM